MLYKFFARIIPTGSVEKKVSLMEDFARAALSRHRWIRMWFYSSLNYTRSLRFLALTNNIMILMFVNTLFYSEFFPSSCRDYSASAGGSNVTCLASTSSWSGHSTCLWDARHGICKINPPPSSLQFYAVVAIIVALFAIVPSTAMSFIMEEYCTKRPELESIGLDSREWLGRPSDPSEYGLPVCRRSELGIAFDREQEREGYHTGPLANEDLGYVLTSALSINEEVNHVLEDARKFLLQYLARTGVSWRDTGLGNEMEARRNAIMKQLGLHLDGSFEPLPLWRRIYFGNAIKLLRAKFHSIRHKSKDILEMMKSFSQGEEDMRDRCLIQYFVLEQMTPLKRFAVSQSIT